MNIKITVGVSPYVLSIEDTSIILDGETQFFSQHTSPLVTANNIVCTQAVYDAIKSTVGTMNAPALIANATAAQYPNRQNVYIENGSLKLVSA